MLLNRAVFSEDDLIRVPLPKNPVIIKSGGPIMEVLSIEGNQVLCEWQHDGKIARGVFSKVILYRLVRMT